MTWHARHRTSIVVGRGLLCEVGCSLCSIWLGVCKLGCVAGVRASGHSEGGQPMCTGIVSDKIRNSLEQERLENMGF